MFETKSTGEKHVLRMLFDSGSEGDIMFMSKKMQRDLPWDMMSLAFPVTWGTSNGTFKTSLRAKMQVLLPEFSQSKLFELEPDVKIVKEDEVKYDLIVGVQTMAAWGVVLDFRKQELTIDEQTICPTTMPWDAIRALLSGSLAAATIEDSDKMNLVEHAIMSNAPLKTVKLLQNAAAKHSQDFYIYVSRSYHDVTKKSVDGKQ
mmetsp:Transcript_12130/g.18710  ORF Transcript_12130/g.18710 Transcript_12130/m.18710 type:complete len:203 (-) Transcript_12130:94-702(-)